MTPKYLNKAELKAIGPGFHESESTRFHQYRSWTDDDLLEAIDFIGAITGESQIRSKGRSSSLQRKKRELLIKRRLRKNSS